MVLGMASARETCVCGATIRLEISENYVGTRLTDWRKEHRHEMSVTKRVGDVSVIKPWYEIMADDWSP